MGLTGKYDFPGIKKFGAAGIKAALSLSPYTAWLLKAPLLDTLLEAIANWFANQGLIVINLGIIYVDGELDQKAFDKAMDQAIEKSKVPGLSDAQKKAIDDDVVQAFRNFARITSQQ